jgi:hypothetical protein
MPSPDSRQTNLPLLTVSSVGDLLGCSKKYHELRVLKRWPKGRKVPSSVPRGSAWHEALRALHAARWEGKLPLADVEAFAQTAVHAARYDREIDKSYEVKRVVEMVKLFCDNQDEEDIAAIIALETQVEFDYKFKGQRLVRIAATIDRALIRPESPSILVVQDYKSTRQQVNLAECFILMWSASKKWPGYEYILELIWVNAEEEQVVIDVVRADVVRNQHKLITTALLKRLTVAPQAESGPACTFCPLRDGCQGLPAVDLAEDEVPF